MKKKKEFSKELIGDYQEYMNERGVTVSADQACVELNTLADLFLIFNKQNMNSREAKNIDICDTVR